MVHGGGRLLFCRRLGGHLSACSKQQRRTGAGSRCCGSKPKQETESKAHNLPPAWKAGCGRCQPHCNSRIATAQGAAVAFRRAVLMGRGQGRAPAGMASGLASAAAVPQTAVRRQPAAGAAARKAALQASALRSRPLQAHQAALLPRSGRPGAPSGPGRRPPSSRGLKTAAGAVPGPHEAAAAARPGAALLTSRSPAAGAACWLPASSPAGCCRKLELRRPLAWGEAGPLDRNASWEGRSRGDQRPMHGAAAGSGRGQGVGAEGARPAFCTRWRPARRAIAISRPRPRHAAGRREPAAPRSEQAHRTGACKGHCLHPSQPSQALCVGLEWCPTIIASDAAAHRGQGRPVRGTRCVAVRGRRRRCPVHRSCGPAAAGPVLFKALDAP